MSWTTASDLKAQVNRLWERGDLLRAVVTEEAIFPMRLTLKAPNSSEVIESFDSVRTWISHLKESSKFRIEWREFKHRVFGNQRIPESAWVDDINAAVALIGKQSETARFRDILAVTRTRQPRLVPWLAKYPLRTAELSDAWDHLLDVADWSLAHPRPNIYLRQVDIPGIHSKFIEAHRAVLADWLDMLLPSEAIDKGQTGGCQFASRFGFREKPNRIRFRVLDSGLALLPGAMLPDVTLDAESFARLTTSIQRVFITENEINFLAFPPAAHSVVVFGAGYGFNELRMASWVRHCTVHYWGDIDTHGFAMLDQLRSHLGHVESFLMDRPTLLAHEGLWGLEEDQVVRDLPRLTSAEMELFNQLRDNRIRKGLRLEQERIGFRWLQTALNQLTGG